MRFFGTTEMAQTLQDLPHLRCGLTRLLVWDNICWLWRSTSKLMISYLDAKDLSLENVCKFLKFEEHLNDLIASLLLLVPLTEFELQEILSIRQIFWSHYASGKITEGKIKSLLVARLMWLSGFYHPSLKITPVENIAAIHITDENAIIKGKMDILTVTEVRAKKTITSFAILLIEAKNIMIDAMEGLPQLLAYAYKKLEHQPSLWGMATNGKDYQFVYIQQGNPPTYHLFPAQSLLYQESSRQLLQVLKAIRNLAQVD